MRLVLALWALAATALLVSPAPAPWAVSLVDVAEQAGLWAVSVYGGLEQKRFIIETNGAGVAFVDVDDDGWVDALVLNGTRLQEGKREDKVWPPGQAPTSQLYRNNHDGTFTDVTDPLRSREDRAGPRPFARGTTTTTGRSTSSSPTTGRTSCTAIAETVASRT